jgi:hypothetical protein
VTIVTLARIKRIVWVIPQNIGLECPVLRRHQTRGRIGCSERPISMQRWTFLLGSRAAKASSSRVARQLTWEAIPAATALQPGQRPIASRAALSVQLGPNQRRYNARVG